MLPFIAGKTAENFPSRFRFTFIIFRATILPVPSFAPGMKAPRNPHNPNSTFVHIQNGSYRTASPFMLREPHASTGSARTKCRSCHPLGRSPFALSTAASGSRRVPIWAPAVLLFIIVPGRVGLCNPGPPS